ncbi:uncharacterized protein EDB91DRAFT_1234119 [Suillus paluster]|uniref:uncharacterized protein n=1 Tax=Suillus paluster TaxID=48578 RepID=UPI001B85D84C|nr:uncharacterized protein EDB91DRAFT_1234119 [Suillus paluster]KAG1753701.1 hypothetical protein EDB91DRAFT_1234119 [Suillus paluster]
MSMSSGTNKSKLEHVLTTRLKCDAEGDPIDQNALPPPQTDTSPDDWTPYESHIAFEMAKFLFLQNQTSAKQIDTLLNLWAASLIKHNDTPPFTDHHDLYNTIDATPLGDIPWETFSMSYSGAKPLHDIPPWMEATYDVWFWDPHLLSHDMLGNPNFDGEMEYVPHQDYSTEDTRCFKNFFSGDWAWGQADIIAQNEVNHGSTFVPLIISSDKTTVLVATGHTKYHPLYMSIGNIFNSTQHAHCNGVVLVGFLAIPKTTKEHAGDTAYHDFQQQMFHCSLAKIFEAIKPYMDTPDVARFPDGHFRRVIYGLGPYIADYPEQVLLSGVVQGWCLKCLADQRDLDGDGPCLRRCKKHRELLIEELKYGKLWEEYGIVSDVVPFTNDYPQADIHELISPDILHQIIKGAFKDHLVDWVESYLKITHEGCGFKQWTGNDSKALMKVYLPAIRGHVPDDIVHTFSTFLDFATLFDDALDQFHRYQEIFKTTGVTLSFSLPCQHSLNHYLFLIWQFGAPNGLCSSITESKHIKAIKEPWRRSSWFKVCGMLKGSCLSIEGEVSEMVDGPAVEAHVDLAATPCCKCDVHALGDELELPNFQQLIQEFIHDQAHTANPNPPVFDPASAPLFLGKVSIFNSAAASFYAPSDLSSTGDISIIHIDCIFHAVHLIPVYGSNILPSAITSHDSYDVFHSYFVNKYADHHAFKIA